MRAMFSSAHLRLRAALPIGLITVVFLGVACTSTPTLIPDAQGAKVPDPTSAPDPAAGAGEHLLTIGDISDEPAEKIERFKPLADYLASQMSDLGFTGGNVVVARDIDEMVSFIEDGKVDIYMDSPFPILKVQKRAQTEFILRRWKDGESSYYSVFVGIDGDTAPSLDAVSGAVVAEENEIEQLRTIERNGKRLNSQIEELLDLSRIQTRRLDISPGWVEWNTFLADIELSMRPLLEAGGHRLMIDQRHGDVWVKIDSDRMIQVVSNLINNACKYSQGADHIDIVSEVSSGEVVLSVTDYGVGIQPADLKNVFTLFYRTRDAIDSAASGTGIGLFVARRIMELHEGDLSIESEYGQGSTAKLTLSSALSEPPSEELASLAFKNRFENLTA